MGRCCEQPLGLVLKQMPFSNTRSCILWTSDSSYMCRPKCHNTVQNMLTFPAGFNCHILIKWPTIQHLYLLSPPSDGHFIQNIRRVRHFSVDFVNYKYSFRWSGKTHHLHTNISRVDFLLLTLQVHLWYMVHSFWAI